MNDLVLDEMMGLRNPSDIKRIAELELEIERLTALLENLMVRWEAVVDAWNREIDRSSAEGNDDE
jgi:hypothetical protein